MYKLIGLTWAGPTDDKQWPLYDFGTYYNQLLNGRGASIAGAFGINHTPDLIFDGYKKMVRQSEYQFWAAPLFSIFVFPLAMVTIAHAHRKQASGTISSFGKMERTKVKAKSLREASEWVDMERSRNKYIETEMNKVFKGIGTFSVNRLKLHTSYVKVDGLLKHGQECFE